MGQVEPRSPLCKLRSGNAALPAGITLNLTMRTCHTVTLHWTGEGLPYHSLASRGEAWVGGSLAGVVGLRAHALCRQTSSQEGGKGWAICMVSPSKLRNQTGDW